MTAFYKKYRWTISNLLSTKKIPWFWIGIFTGCFWSSLNSIERGAGMIVLRSILNKEDYLSFKYSSSNTVNEKHECIAFPFCFLLSSIILWFFFLNLFRWERCLRMGLFYPSFSVAVIGAVFRLLYFESYFSLTIFLLGFCCLFCACYCEKTISLLG